jgi:PAS domain S-box-containing protein
MNDHVNNWWNTIAGAIEDGFIVTDSQSHIVAWNESALHILQVSVPEIQHLKPIAALLQLKQEFSGKEIDLGQKWLKINGRRFLTETGEGYLLTFTDISRNKSLGNIISALDDIVLEVAADGTILHVWMNKATRLTLPWRKMEGRYADDYMPADLITDIKAEMKAVYESGEERIKTYHDPLQKKEEIWYRARLMLSGNANNSILISLEDVTAECKTQKELKHTKYQLEESQQVFESVFNYSPTGIALIGPDGKWMNVNASMLNTLGYTIHEMREREISDIIHPDDRSHAVNQISMMLNREINTYRAERRYKHKDGHYIWVFLAASLLWNPDGTARFFILQLVDVSELKTLITEAQKKNIILHATSVDLQQKIKQLQEFNKIIAHNLGAPAAALVSSTDLLPEMKEDAARERMLQHMKTTAGMILGTLNDLKQVLHLSGNEQIPFSRCKLKPLISQQWALLKSTADKKQAILNFNLKVEFVHYVKTYLENILFNLLSNAVTYTRPGVQPEISVSSWEEEDEIVLKVSDNGMGIDLDKHGAQLFKYKKVFHRGVGGPGIGLFMIKNQIKTFGGSIKVKSEAGKGSSFYVYFNNKREPILQKDE